MQKRIDAYKYAMRLRKESGLGRRRIYKKLKEANYNIPAGSIQYWLNGGKPSLKELSENSKVLTKEKAYILGVVGPGDGYILTGDIGIGLSVIDEDFSNKFKSCVEKVYGFKCAKYIVKKPTGFGKNKLYKVILYSTESVKDLRMYGVPLNEKEWLVPDVIKCADFIIQTAYIAGFADSQGSVGKRTVPIASNNKKGLKEIRKLLLNLSIRSNIQKSNKIYLIAIQDRRSIELFAQKIGFSISRKKQKLRDLIRGYKHYHTTQDVMATLKPKIISYLNLGYSQRKISRELNISTTPIRKIVKEVG